MHSQCVRQPVRRATAELIGDFFWTVNFNRVTVESKIPAELRVTLGGYAWLVQSLSLANSKCLPVPQPRGIAVEFKRR